MTYGYVNGKAVNSRDEFIFKSRNIDAFETDAEIFEYARKVTSDWHVNCGSGNFRTFYLSDYELNEPYCSLTNDEFARLKSMQKIAREEHEKAEQAREWKKVRTEYYADNSVEELWRDKNGFEKRVLVDGPHGDAC